MITRLGTVITISISIILVAAEARGNSSNQAQKSGCPRAAPGVDRLIEDFRRFPLEVAALGSFRVYPNDATRKVVRLGLPAVEPLLRASQGEDRLIAIYSVFSLGQIMVNAGGKSSPPSEPCKALVISTLKELKARYEKNPRDEFDFTLIGTINSALENLGVAVVKLPPVDPCCVTDVEIIGPAGTPTDFKGGKSFDDYYSDLVGRGFWKDKNKGGPFDTGGRVGAAIQFVATCTGNRANCKFTQHYTIPETTYPGEPVTTTPVDDIARSGRGADPNFRQDIGANQTSIADPASYPYNGTSNFAATNVFVTCMESNSPTCQWDRCCIQWTWEVKVQNGAVVSNTITPDRKWCEKKF